MMSIGELSCSKTQTKLITILNSVCCALINDYVCSSVAYELGYCNENSFDLQ